MINGMPIFLSLLEKLFQKDYAAIKKSNYRLIIFTLKRFVRLLSFCHTFGVRLASVCYPFASLSFCYPFAIRSGFSPPVMSSKNHNALQWVQSGSPLSDYRQQTSAGEIMKIPCINGTDIYMRRNVLINFNTLAFRPVLC